VSKSKLFSIRACKRVLHMCTRAQKCAHVCVHERNHISRTNHRTVEIRLFADLTRFRRFPRRPPTRLIHLSRVSTETSNNASRLCSSCIAEIVPVIISGVSCRLWKSGFLKYISYVFVYLANLDMRVRLIRGVQVFKKDFNTNSILMSY